jgi:hypothetical protein
MRPRLSTGELGQLFLRERQLAAGNVADEVAEPSEDSPVRRDVERLE